MAAADQYIVHVFNRYLNIRVIQRNTIMSNKY